MNSIKKKVRSDLQKLVSSADLYLSEGRVIYSLDVEVLMDITRRFYEDLSELRMLTQEAITSGTPLSGKETGNPAQLATNNNKPETITSNIAWEVEITEKPSVLEEVKESFVQPNEIPYQEEEVMHVFPKEEAVQKVIPLQETESDSEKKSIPEINPIKESPIVQHNTLFELEEEPAKVEKVKQKPDLLEYIKSTHTPLHKKPTAPAVSTPAPTTIADAFSKKESHSILDKISPIIEKNSIESRIQQSLVNDIRQIIGINEKFLFINDLFEGDMRLYNDVILTLNSYDTTQEALYYFNKMASERNWDKESLAFISFFKIFERKFS